MPDDISNDQFSEKIDTIISLTEDKSSASSNSCSQNVKNLPELYFDIVSDVTIALDAARVLDKFIPLYNNSFEGVTNSVTAFVASMSDLNEQVARITQVVNEATLPILESFRKAASQIDWKGLTRFSNLEELKNGARTWGCYGWPISMLELAEIENPPATVLEADKFYDNLVSNNSFQSVIENIDSNISRKKDFQECVELYRKRRYKPCAMGLCALIEGQLVTSMPKNRRRRNGMAALNSLSDAEYGLIKALRFVSTVETYKYFFKSGDNFNRKIEGELNRNFLMHGMMYKPVKKRSCIKLFMLLEAVVDMLSVEGVS